MSGQSRKPFLMWLYPGYLDQALSSATWLDTALELRKMGWKVLLVAAGPLGLRSIRDTEVYCVPMPDLYLIRQLVFHLGFYWLLIRYRFRMDIILFHPLSAVWLLPVRLICWLTKKRRPLLVIDIRSLHMPQANGQGIRDWLRGRFQDYVVQEAKHWVHGYLTITSRLADAIRTPQDILWGTWPSGVNLSLFEPVQRAHRWPPMSDPVRLIYIGHLNVERNLMSLCQAVEQANSEGMMFELWLVGEGNGRSELEEYAAQTRGRIMVKPPVSHAKVPQLLAEAHVGVLPFPDEPKFQVSSPIKLFEYMAAGMPVLATRVYCHTDVIGDSKYVFWAENADSSGLLGALRLAWQDRAKLRDMGVLAASASSAWTWRESALKLSRALELGLERNS